MNMKTPRTDVKIERICGNWNNAGDRVQEFVLADFARQLERELAETRQQRDRLAEALNEMMEDYVFAGCVANTTMEKAEQALAAVKGEKL